MSEFRQNLASKEWVIIAPERGKKPRPMEKGGEENEGQPRPVYDPDCPFCPGNHERFPSVERHRVPSGAQDWAVRVMDNKFKLLDSFSASPARPGAYDVDGIYRRLPGCGSHELVIETPRHDLTMADLPEQALRDVISVYLARYAAFPENPNNLLTVIFKNFGLGAGQSQPHAHSQIVGSRVVPLHIRNLLREAERHFDTVGTCVFCDILDHELAEGTRIVCENADYVALVPYAAAVEHETWIVPREHRAGLDRVTGRKVDTLARIMRSVLTRFRLALGSLDFNFVFRTPTYPLADVPFFHWHIRFIPRMKTTGGFEQGTRIHVNTIAPEHSAGLLRDCGASDD
jgi:UDPglucose--hexose-1-phosphate uridylyltransferase